MGGDVRQGRAGDTESDKPMWYEYFI